MLCTSSSICLQLVVNGMMALLMAVLSLIMRSNYYLFMESSCYEAGVSAAAHADAHVPLDMMYMMPSVLCMEMAVLLSLCYST
jgi:hypothetical protein